MFSVDLKASSEIPLLEKVEKRRKSDLLFRGFASSTSF